jgi:class 3 adenylate cyclase
VTCASCGQERLPQANFCTRCGHGFKRECAACDFGNPADASFCARCGRPLTELAAGDDGEKRPITVLFCDRVKSTALSQELDPEDVREIEKTLGRIFIETATLHRGYVAETPGDGVVIYFGFRRAEEDDAERAVRCGLELVRRVSILRGTTSLPIPLAVRVGIHASNVALGPVEAAVDKYWKAYGDATNIAAGLQALADPGEVVVSGDAWSVVKGVFAGESLGPRQIKGGRPIAVWRVAGERGPGEESDSVRSSSPFVGRRLERTAFEDVWQAAARGETQFVLLRSDPGMGKSRLARLWREEVLSSGARLLSTRATPNNRNQPFHPIIVLLEQTFGLQRSQSASVRLDCLERAVLDLGLEQRATVPFLAALLDIPTGASYESDDLSPVRRRSRIFEVVTEVFGRIARQGPTLLICEDVHWVDESTSELMRHIVTNLAEVPLLGLFTARQEIEANWATAAPVRVLNLTKLNWAESEAVARGIAGGKALPGEVLRQILTRAEGVPLFVEELTRSVLELGVLEERSASWEAVKELPKELIPMGIHASLAARIDRLGPSRATAQLAATIGREFSVTLLRAVSDRDEETLQADLRRLERAGLAWESEDSGPDTFTFKHALVRDAAYGSLLRNTRQSYHSRIAAALRGPLAELAHNRNDLIAIHLANAGEHEEAVAFWQAAGHDALLRTSNLEAAGHFRRAIDCLNALPATAGREGRELELEILIAPVLMSVYGWASAEVENACKRGRALAEKLEQRDRLYAPLWGSWSVYFLRGELNTAMPEAQAIQQMAEASGIPLIQVTGRHATAYTHLFRGELEQALHEAEAGLRLFDLAQEQALAAAFQLSSSVCLRQSRAQALWMLGRVDEADVEAEEMLRLGRQLDHRSSLAGALAFALHGGGVRHSYTGGMVRLLDIADELCQLSNDEGFYMWHAVAQTYRGVIGLALGEPGARERTTEGLEQFVQTRTRVTLVMMNVMVAEALHARRDDEMALRLLDEAEREASARHEYLHAPEIARVRGRVLAARGESHAAEASYVRGLQLATAQDAHSLSLRAALDLHDLLAANGRAERGASSVASVLARMPAGQTSPEHIRAREILGAVLS